MKKLLAILFAFMFPFLAGCAPEIIRAGAERDAVLYGAQIEMERTRLETPACRIVAVPGEEIMLSGVAEFSCYASAGAGDNDIKQRISPIWGFMSQNSGILGILGWSAIMYPSGISSGVQTITTPAPEVVRPEIVRPEVIFAP